MTAEHTRTESTSRVGHVLISAEGPVVTATIDRPEKRNAIDYGVIEGLSAAVDTAVDREATLLVLRGAGGHFSAGADLNLIRATLEDASELATYVTRLSEVCDRLADGPFVSLAVVTGYALAGGCELLLACDLALASEDAQIGDRHLQNSLLPGGGGSVRLSRALTPARARRLLFTAEIITGATAAEWGLVSGAYPPAELEEQVAALSRSLCTKAPEALRRAKSMLAAADERPIAEALAEERRIFVDYAAGNAALHAALTTFLSRGSAARAPGVGQAS